MKRKGNFIGWIWIASLIFSVSLAAATEQTKITAESIKGKPDLKILGVVAERTGLAPSGTHQVRVRVTVLNSALGSVCAGPFAVKLEKRARPAGEYALLGQKSVTRLCTDPASARAATTTLDFTDTVPVGEQRQWRAWADSGHQVDEANEGNNLGESAIYVAKSFCPGVDLALSKVEIKRESDGEVFIRAWGRNRCIGSCVSQVKFTFEATEPANDELPTVQPIAVAINSLSDFATNWVGIWAPAGDDVTYRVRIDPESDACMDGNPGNNECLATLTAEEDSEIKVCR